MKWTLFLVIMVVILGLIAIPVIMMQEDNYVKNTSDKKIDWNITARDLLNAKEYEAGHPLNTLNVSINSPSDYITDSGLRLQVNPSYFKIKDRCKTNEEGNFVSWKMEENNITSYCFGFHNESCRSQNMNLCFTEQFMKEWSKRMKEIER